MNAVKTVASAQMKTVASAQMKSAQSSLNDHRSRSLVSCS
jgi:hypothetical protein